MVACPYCADRVEVLISKRQSDAFGGESSSFTSISDTSGIFSGRQLILVQVVPSPILDGRVMSFARPAFSSNVPIRSLPRSFQCLHVRPTYHQKSLFPRPRGDRTINTCTTRSRTPWGHQERNMGLVGPWRVNLSRSRRAFATTPVACHGHLDPPKPGEEYVTRSRDVHPKIIPKLQGSNGHASFAGAMSRSLIKKGKSTPLKFLTGAIFSTSRKPTI